MEENTLGAVAASLKGMIERREEADAVEEWLEAIDPTLFIAELSFYSSEVRQEREKEWRGKERREEERRGYKLHLEIIS